MGDDFDAETFGDRSMTNVGSQMGHDALKSHMNRFFDAENNLTKGIGYIAGMNGSRPMGSVDPAMEELIRR